MSHYYKAVLGDYMKRKTQVAPYSRRTMLRYHQCNTPAPWAMSITFSLFFYLISGLKRAEFPLKMDRFQAESLTINPYKSTEAYNILK